MTKENQIKTRKSIMFQFQNPPLHLKWQNNHLCM
jgi:hypothetical protein